MYCVPPLWVSGRRYYIVETNLKRTANDVDEDEDENDDIQIKSTEMYKFGIGSESIAVAKPAHLIWYPTGVFVCNRTRVCFCATMDFHFILSGAFIGRLMGRSSSIHGICAMCNA